MGVVGRIGLAKETMAETTAQISMAGCPTATKFSGKEEDWPAWKVQARAVLTYQGLGGTLKPEFKNQLPDSEVAYELLDETVHSISAPWCKATSRFGPPELYLNWESATLLTSCARVRRPAGAKQQRQRGHSDRYCAVTMTAAPWPVWRIRLREFDHPNSQYF